MMLILFCLQGSYNGNNTIDEVLFGIEVGSLIAGFSHFWLRERLDSHVTKLMDGLYVNRYKRLLLTFTVSFLGAFLFITIVYVTALADFHPDKKWL